MVPTRHTATKIGGPEETIRRVYGLAVNHFSSASYATSLSSYVEDYKWVYGRRFHAYREGGKRSAYFAYISDILTCNRSAYNFPNDEQEQDRLDLFHHLFGLRLNGKLHLYVLDCMSSHSM